MTKYRKADIIEASTLDYTIIRPWLTFKNETDYEVTSKDTQFRGTEVSRRSIASLVRIAKTQNYILKKT